MSKEESFKIIKEFLIKRYKENLAGILIFGSANTGEFKEGKSDIDTMIFLKQKKDLDFKEEIKVLLESLKSEKFACQYLFSLEDLKEYIQKRVSFSTYITILSNEGSKVLYSTPELNETKEYLRDNSPSKERIKKYIQEKDEFELKGYFKERKGFDITKALFSHLRRKLQVLNYLNTKNLIFNYEECLKKSDLDKRIKKDLKILLEYYKKGIELSEKDIQKYYSIANDLTKMILSIN